MKKFENLMLLSATAALSALLTVGCAKKDSGAAEPKQPTSEVQEHPSDDSADHPKSEGDSEHPKAEGDSEHPNAEGDSEHPSDGEKKTDHPKSDHPK